MTEAPWQCPSCGTWMAPGVTEHRCDPPDAGVTAPVVPISPAGGISVSGVPDGWSVGYTTTSGRNYELDPPQPATVTVHMHAQLDGAQIARTIREQAGRRRPGLGAA